MARNHNHSFKTTPIKEDTRQQAYEYQYVMRGINHAFLSVDHDFRSTNERGLPFTH